MAAFGFPMWRPRPRIKTFTASADLTITASDLADCDRAIVECDSTGGGFTVTLPALSGLVSPVEVMLVDLGGATSTSGKHVGLDCAGATLLKQKVSGAAFALPLNVLTVDHQSAVFYLPVGGASIFEWGF